MHSRDLLLIFSAALVLQNPKLSFWGGGGLFIVVIMCTLFSDVGNDGSSNLSQLLMLFICVDMNLVPNWFY